MFCFVFKSLQNQFMMGYMSHLVEVEEFDWIEMRFLVVGHTHCSIDQYFSVLSAFLSTCAFIPTPMALRYVLSIAHNEDNKRPLIVRPLNVRIASNSNFGKQTVSHSLSFWLNCCRRSTITRHSTIES